MEYKDQVKAILQDPYTHICTSCMLKWINTYTNGPTRTECPQWLLFFFWVFNLELPTRQVEANPFFFPCRATIFQISAASGIKRLILTSQQYRVFACILLAYSVWLRRSPCLLWLFFFFFQTKDSPLCAISASHLTPATWTYTLSLQLFQCLLEVMFHILKGEGALLPPRLYSVAGAISCNTLLHASK